MRVSAVVLACVLAACGGASTAGPSRGATASPSDSGACQGSVTLRFAWPDTLQANISGTARNFDSGRDWPDGFSPGLVMRVGAERDGAHRIRFATSERAPESVAHGLFPTVDGRYADVIVARDGSVAEIAGGEQMRMALLALARTQNIDDEQIRLVAEALADEWMLAHARAYWGHVAGTWSGVTLACGTPSTVHRAGMDVNFGHVDADVTETLEWLGWRPCARGTNEQRQGRCVALRSVETASQPHVQIDPSRPPGRVDVKRTIDVLVEPDTLVPHALAFTEETRVLGDASPLTILGNDVRFSYVEPTAATERTILALQQRGWMFYWPSDPHTAGPMQLPDEPLCRQLLACCQALSQRSPEEGVLCASAVAAQVGGDCDTPLRLTAVTELANHRELPPECEPPRASSPGGGQNAT